MSTLCVFSTVDFVKMCLSASPVGHMLAASKRRPTPNSLQASMMSCAVTENKRNPHKYKDKCTGSSVESAKTKNGLLFFPPSHRHPHTHTAHILCVITIHWTRGGVHPGSPSHTGGVITPASHSWPCLKFSYYSPKSLMQFSVYC